MKLPEDIEKIVKSPKQYSTEVALTPIDTDAQQKLIKAGYRVEQREYYNPGGEIEYDAVIYPDGGCELYVGRGHRLSLDEQWSLAYRHWLTKSEKTSEDTHAE